jgi:DnaJ-class molecular chaperone
MTARDFYVMLGISPAAQSEEIVKAYKTLATEWHPDIHSGKIDAMDAEINFQQLSEAIQVLNDPASRNAYDQFGESGLNIIFRNGRDIFNEYFGTQGLPKDPAIKREFNVSLEKLYRGETKKFNITKHIQEEDGNVTTQSKILEIQLKSHWKSGTKITFPKEGDVRPNVEPADMIFILREKPHPYFKRERDNLIYVANITLKQALCGIKISIPTLDGEQTLVQIFEPISPERAHVIPGKGMPNTKTNHTGDLIVRFNVQFPTSLEKNQKDFIKSAFQDVTSWK